MAIISKIGRRSLKVRCLILGIYALLIAGSVSMLYPFLLMVAGSTKSATDASENRLIPGFLARDEALWRKHVEGLFNESLQMMQQVFYTDTPSFDRLSLPEHPNRALADAWTGFLREVELPDYAWTLGYVYAPVSRGVTPHMMREFKDELIDRFDGDVQRLNAEFGTEFVGWNAVFLRPEQTLQRRDQPLQTPFGRAFREFKTRQDLRDRYYFTPEGFYRQYLRTQYTRKIDKYNEEHGTSYASYDEIHLDRRYPTGPGRTDAERKDWEEFVRTLLNLLWVRADAEAAPSYHEFLRAKYGDLARLNESYGTAYGSFDEVPLVVEPPAEGIVLSDWDAFVQGWEDPDSGRMHELPVEHVRIYSLDFLFRDHLRRKYGTLAKANAALGTSYPDWLAVLPPQEDAHVFWFRKRTGALRWEFVIRNYVTVVDTMILHGRGILNTAIYCTLAVLGALLVNPLGAYALSRYKPPSAYKVLLFLMLTMAFPPMVTQIPVFLMLREFNMLNTFWALILPGLANGYSIFLLKGFFDSLPSELYESAALDGAGELRIFWQITMSLSKPILAVIALNAFTAAYSNFMFALLICQDEKMWTLMVWMYELQQRSGQGVVFASLIIAAVPTFLMFALCQKIIMRGIVVPVEK
jgi:multiple sugar transport system permease protein